MFGMKQKEMKAKLIHLPEDVWDALGADAVKGNRNVTQYVQMILARESGLMQFMDDSKPEVETLKAKVKELEAELLIHKGF